MNERSSINHFESAFDYFWQARSSMLKGQMEWVVASMTVGIEFWQMWQTNRGTRAINAVETSYFGDRKVISATFKRVR